MSPARFVSVVAVAAALLVAPAARPAHAGLSKGLKCAFAKQRVAVKKIDALLACERKARTAQTPVDPACTAAATARFETAFQRIEMRGGCEPSGDTVPVEQVADRCAEQLGLQLQGVCTMAGAPCGGNASALLPGPGLLRRDRGKPDLPLGTPRRKASAPPFRLSKVARAASK